MRDAGSQAGELPLADPHDPAAGPDRGLTRAGVRASPARPAARLRRKGDPGHVPGAGGPGRRRAEGPVMPIGHRAHLDRYIPPRSVVRTTEFGAGRASRAAMPRAWARRLQRYLGPITRRHFRDVMESKRPLRYDTWTSRRSTSPGASASARPRWRRVSRGRPRDGPTPSRASPPPRRARPRPRSGSASGCREPGPRRLRSRRRCRPRPRPTIGPGSGSAGRAASYDRPGVAGHDPLEGGVRDRGRRGPDRDRARRPDR